MHRKWVTVIHTYKNYAIGYIRYGNVHIYAEIADNASTVSNMLQKRIELIDTNFKFY